MKKKKTLLFSLVLFLIVLLFWGQQEIEKNKSLLDRLAKTEEQNYIFTSSDFAEIVKTEATPLITYFQNKEINRLLVFKCQLGQVVFLTGKNGQEVTMNPFGDFGTISYEVERGAKVKQPNHQEEANYYEKVGADHLKNFGFSRWDIIFYWLKKALLTLLVFLPLFFSLKIFFLLTILLIILIQVLDLNNYCQKDKNSEKTIKECSIKKPPPKISERSFSFYAQVFIVPDKQEVQPLIFIKVIFFKEVNDKIRKVVNKVFHVPEIKFVLN
jgi:hypothetical protein